MDEETAGGPVPYASEPLIVEADHRIANNLVLLTILLRRQAAAARRRAEPIDPAVVAAMLEDCAQRVQAIGILHRMLSSGADTRDVSLGDYLRHLCRAVSDASSGEGRIAFDFSGAELLVPARMTAEIGLIVTELALNAVRHGRPDGCCNIAVTCHHDGDGALNLIVGDDGVGLPAGFDPVRRAGTGLQVVQALVGRFAGELRFDSTAEGLRVTLAIPAAALRERRRAS